MLIRSHKLNTVLEYTRFHNNAIRYKTDKSSIYLFSHTRQNFTF